MYDFFSIIKLNMKKKIMFFFNIFFSSTFLKPNITKAAFLISMLSWCCTHISSLVATSNVKLSKCDMGYLENILSARL